MYTSQCVRMANVWAEQWCPVKGHGCISEVSCIILYTVKPVYKDHSRD